MDFDQYSFKPYYGSSHVWAMKYLHKVPLQSRVLDVGPGSGFCGCVLRNRGLTELEAIETDSNRIKLLSPLYRRIERNINAYKGELFDLILLLDVLEHMTQPLVFFKEVLRLLAPGALLVVSVPNVAHWSVRLPLLFGFFEYYDRGILDRTHYQFFTRRRFKHLLAGGNLIVEEITSSISPAELVLPKAFWDNQVFHFLSRARQLGANILPGLFAYQHLAALRKPPAPT